MTTKYLNKAWLVYRVKMKEWDNGGAQQEAQLRKYTQTNTPTVYTVQYSVNKHIE